MRTSSVKITVSAFAIALTLAFAVPSADARSVRGGTRVGRGEAIMRAAINYLKRLGGMVTNARPSVPFGDEELPSDSGTSTAPTAPSETTTTAQ